MAVPVDNTTKGEDRTMTEIARRTRLARNIAELAISRRRALKLGAAAGGAAMLGLRPAGSVAAAPATPTGQIIVGISQEPTVFQPLMLHIEVDEGVYFNLFSPLWVVDDRGNWVPLLASEIPTRENGGVSEDGRVWTIRLRDGVTWHDGEPFTAEDVKFTLELIKNPDFRAERRAGHELITDIKVLSPTELTWTMEKPYAPYASILSWTFIVPRHLLENVADINAPADFLSKPIGTGPFKFVERVPGDIVMLEANTDYFGDGPHVERLVFKYVPDLTVLYTQFKTGDIDYIGLQGISPDHYAEASMLPDRKVAPAPLPFIENIGLNLGLPQFQDPKVREALYLAMDKATIIDAIYYGLPSPTESFLPAQSWAYNPDLPKHAYDPERARALLDEAGWLPGADGIREKDGVRLEFTNSTTAGNHTREQTQQFLQQSWAEIGARMTIDNLPPAVMWGDFWMQSRFQSAMVGIAFMIGPDPDCSDYFHSASINAQGGAGQNTVQYRSEEADRLLAEGAATVDIAERTRVYQELQQVTRRDLPYLPIFQYAMVEGTKADLEGFAANVNVRTNCWNIASWHWTA